MDFSLSDEQQLLRDTARTVLAKECPPALVRAHIDDPAAADPLWERLRDFAGLGTGPLTDLCLFTEETGFVAAPGPFFATTALFAPVLAATGHELLTPTLAGDTTGTVALAGADGAWQVNDEPVKCFVPELDRVDWVAVVSPGPQVQVVATAGLPIRLLTTADWSRRLFELDVTDLHASKVPIAPDAVDDTVRAATVAVSAELVGTARRLFDMALEYAKQRVQFDRPIGSFQAIQHKLADVSLAVERADSAVQYAAMTIDAHDGDRRRATHVAKAAAGTAATRAAKDSIQVHGGVGYTWEHDLHLFIRRAYGSEAWFGPTGWHHDRLAELLLDPRA
jgi:alkylation response protein AidB-like acyl-CoA dehydrogenase